jgi:hypothetical protein
MIILEIYFMNYYELIKPWEPELLGIKDGLAQAEVLESGFKNKSNYKIFIDLFAMAKLPQSQAVFSADFELECVKLRKGAKLTDFLWFAPRSYSLVSPKVYSVLAHQSLPPHKFFPAVIEDSTGKKINGYKFFYLPSLDANHIAFNHCKFEVGNEHEGFKEVVIKSSDELFSIDDNLIVKMMSLMDVSSELAMYKVKLPVGVLISESLYCKLASLNVTGVKFNKIDLEVLDVG